MFAMPSIFSSGYTTNEPPKKEGPILTNPSRRQPNHMYRSNFIVDPITKHTNRAHEVIKLLLYNDYQMRGVTCTRSDSREIERPVFDCFRGD